MTVRPRVSPRNRGLGFELGSSPSAVGRIATRSGDRAVTLIELLCVMGIIGILMSLMAPAAFKALKKARQLSGEVEGPAFQAEIQRKYTPYRLANPNHPTLDRDAFIQACGLSAKASSWLRSPEVRFVPFSGVAPATTIVIEQRLQVIQNRPPGMVYTVMDLLLPEPR